MDQQTIITLAVICLFIVGAAVGFFIILYGPNMKEWDRNRD